MTELQEIRAARGPLLQQLADLQASEDGQDEARQPIAQRVRASNAEGHEGLRRLVTGGHFSDLFVVKVSPGGRLDLLPILAALLGPDEIMAVLERHIATLPPSVPAAERAAMTAEIADELHELEEREEAEICRLEERGERPDRRADADPSVVLRMRG